MKFKLLSTKYAKEAIKIAYYVFNSDVHLCEGQRQTSLKLETSVQIYFTYNAYFTLSPATQI